MDRCAPDGLDGLPDGEKSTRYAFAIVCLMGGIAATRAILRDRFTLDPRGRTAIKGLAMWKPSG